MDRSHRRPAATARPVVGTRPKAKHIGFIGKADISDYETACLQYIGKCLAALGHTLVSVPARGSEAALRVGVEAQGGAVHSIGAGVLDTAERTLLYPDPHLTERLKKAYPDIEHRDDVVFITDGQLHEWVDAMKQILDDHGINRP